VAGTQQQVERLTVSVGLLSRVVFTQAIVRGLSTMRDEFKKTAESAMEFQRSSMEASIISGEPYEALKSRIRAFSDALNVPLLESSKGAYWAFSNALGDTAQTFDVLTEAAKFSKSTNADLKDSINLLSAAIHGFGLETSDAGRIAAIFHEGIARGRLTASELSSAFGKVNTRAADLGISLEEVVAGLTSITVKGLGARESATMFSGVLTALTKTTPAMTKALNEMGFSSAETAIATMGLPALLQAVADSSDGTARSMSKLFPNIRGIAGQLALTGDGLKTYAKNLDAANEATKKLADSNYAKAISTDAAEVERQLNRLRNIMTADFGQAALKATADLSRFVGGVDGLERIAQASGPALLGLGATLLTLGGALASTRLGALNLAKALTALALIPVAEGFGRSLGLMIDQKMFDKSMEATRAIDLANQKLLDNAKQREAARLKVAQEADKARLQSFLAMSAIINQAYLEQGKAAEKAFRTTGDVKRTAPAEDETWSEKTARWQSELMARVPKGPSYQFDPKRLRGLYGDIGFDVGKAEKMLGKDLLTPDAISRAAIEIADRVAKMRKQEADVWTQQDTLLGKQYSLSSVFDAISARGDKRRTLGATFGIEEGNRAFNSLQKEFVETSEKSKITDEDIVKLTGDLKMFKDAVNENVLSKLTFGTDVERMQVALNKMTEIHDLQKGIADSPALNRNTMQELSNYEAILLRMEKAADIIRQRLENAARAGNSISNINTGASAAPAAPTAPEANWSDWSDWFLSEAAGGLIGYFRRGGQPRGSDTVPAMLSPGEFIVNAASTRKWYSQLVAINAGIAPTYRESGGQVTNVGDITVNLNSGGNVAQTAREIGQALNREIRRGILSMRR